MGIQPDTWIREMALRTRQIEPFVDGQVRQDVISYGLSSCSYDIRVVKMNSNLHQRFRPSSIPNISTKIIHRLRWRRLHHSAELVCIGTNGRNTFAFHATYHYLRRQEYVCTLWLDRQCDAV